MPNTYKAEDTTIVDVADLFVSTEVEGALAELMAKANLLTTLDGDAAVGNVLISKTFYNTSITAKRTGTMPNNAGDTNAISAHLDGAYLHVIPTTGYYDGVDDATVTDAQQAGYTLLTTEDHNSMIEYLVVGGYTTERLMKFTLYDLAYREKSPAISVNDANISGIANDTVNILFSTYDFNTQVARATYDFQDAMGKGSVLYGAYGRCVSCDTTANTGRVFYGTNSGLVQSVQKKYISGVGGEGIHQYEYGGAVYGVSWLANHVYAGGATVKKVYKLNEADLSKDAESADYGGTIYAVHNAGTYVYCGGATTEKVWKIDTADMSKLAESADLGTTIQCITSDSTHLYVGCANGYVYKLLKSDMTTVASAACYTGIIYAITNYLSYVYIGGATTQKVYKLLKTDLSIVAQSITYGGDIHGLCFGPLVAV
jgi:hypothetical protein